MALNILLIAVLGLAAELVLPWWSVVLGAFGVGAWRGASGWRSAFDGFSGVGLLWLAAVVAVHVRSQGILTQRLAGMFGMPAGFMLLLLTGVVGGLAGAAAAACGYWFRMLFFSPPQPLQPQSELLKKSYGVK